MLAILHSIGSNMDTLAVGMERDNGEPLPGCHSNLGTSNIF